jgi:sugar phosphate isomerase/epimerase
MSAPSRRRFLGSTFLAAAGLAVAAPTSPGIEPIPRTGKPRMRLSLAAYSFRKYLDLKTKPAPSMTLDDFADYAATLDLDAIEPTAYYFADTSPAYLAGLKGRCIRLGLDISGTAVGNNFCVPDPARLKEQIGSVKQWVERASLLGAKTIRIFAGNVAKGDSEEKARARCIEAIQESCDHAGKYGVYLALENHGGLTATVEGTLQLVQAVKHPWFGVNLDTGNFHTDDPYADLAKLAPYAVTVQIKTEIQRKGMKKEEADLKRLLDMLRAVNYRGYVALEYEATEEPKTAVPRYVAELRKLIA